MGILIKAPTRRRDTGDPVVVPPASADTRSALHIREVVRITGLRREQSTARAEVLEELGSYDPVVNPPVLSLDRDRARHPRAGLITPPHRPRPKLHARLGRRETRCGRSAWRCSSRSPRSLRAASAAPPPRP